MKKFLHNILSLGIILFLVLFILIFYKPFVYKNFSYKLPDNKHVLFMGASLLEKSINDNLITSSENLCMSAEPHLYTYLKLKYLLRDNKQIDTVFMGLGPFNLHQNADARYFDQNQDFYFVLLFYPLFSLNEYSLMLDRNPLNFLENLLRSVGHHYYFSGEMYMNQFGSFKKILRNMDKNKNLNLKKDKNNKGNTINLLYLKKINELCREHQVQLYYIYTPMYNHSEIPYEDNFYQIYKSQFSDVPLLDYSNWNVPDSCREDAFHLNYYGSILFTTEIKRRFNFK